MLQPGIKLGRHNAKDRPDVGLKERFQAVDREAVERLVREHVGAPPDADVDFETPGADDVFGVSVYWRLP